MVRIKMTHRLATPEKLAAQAGPSHVAELEMAQEIKDRPDARETLFDSDLEKEIEEYGGGEEDLLADLEIEFDASFKA